MKKLLGHVSVDSGQVMVCDPCYIDSTWENTSHIELAQEVQPMENLCAKHAQEFNYLGACNATLNNENSGGQFWLAVACSSGNGDGSYPVYATYDRDGVVKKLEIVFIR